VEGSSTATQTLERGREALASGAWERALSLFERCLEEASSGAALEGLAIANYWLGNEEATLEYWPQAFAEYQREGNAQAAAYTAIMLAAEYRIAGNASISSGWLGRTTRLLEGCENCQARGWLEIERAKRESDPRKAAEHSEAAVAIARELSAPDLEACALSHLGLAKISDGEVEGGLQILDEALALATGVQAKDTFATVDACCTTLIACEGIADPERARDWGRAITEFIRRRNYMPLSAWCRAVYAGFLVTTGAWDAAESELRAALDDAERAGGSNPYTALATLAELRLLQGRQEEAARLLSGIEDRPGALRAVIALHLAKGEVDLAAEKIGHRLESASATGSHAEVAALNVALSRIELRREDAAAAKVAAETASGHGRLASRDDLLALCNVLAAEAALLAGDEPQPDQIERAIDLFAELTMPLEEGRARLVLAQILRPGRAALAIEQARAALRIFEGLGAGPDADAAAKLLRDLGAPGRAAPRGGELSKRETEVLALLAAGLSNAEIAERLVISPRTAEHHVAAILRKLELRNRAEAAAYATRSGARP
jgi:DNA-binding NarL/FixJ family response regulator